MSDILKTIIDDRRNDLAASKCKVPIETLMELASKRKHRSLITRIKRNSGTHIIAEMKKASPSAGILRQEYLPVEIAKEYEKSGATALSVLTEPRYFMGKGEHLSLARKAVELPVLRKDFIFDEYQMYESASWGADVVLLIAAALKEDEMGLLYDKALECGLEVIMEVHAEQELKTALNFKNAIIGINSRNLKTLETDLKVARTLALKIPRDRLLIAESGIRSRADIESLEQCGYSGFLVGEALMKAGNPGSELAKLLGRK